MQTPVSSKYKYQYHPNANTNIIQMQTPVSS